MDGGKSLSIFFMVFVKRGILVVYLKSIILRNLKYLRWNVFRKKLNFQLLIIFAK